jgi:hypothetical protein
MIANLSIAEHLPDDPFYTKWWFLVILALASLVVIVVVIALLCVTGRNNKYKYEKRNSADSLQLADGGIVSYELRASQRNKQTRHNRYVAFYFWHIFDCRSNRANIPCVFLSVL